jgi:hypothetical protein
MRARVPWLTGSMVVALGCSAAPRRDPVASAPPAQAVVDPLAELPPDVRQLAHEVEEVRGLTFRRPLTVIALDDADFVRHFSEGLLEQTPDASNAPALWAFGFLRARPPPSWLTALFARRNRTEDTRSTLAFYVDASRRVYIRRHLVIDPLTMAHELAHALVHDHFQVSFDVPTDDQQLAVRSLVEGDATLTAFLVIERRKGRTLAVKLERAFSHDRTSRDFVSDTDAALGKTLPLYRERSELPYQSGATFAARVVLARGMPGLNQIWADPPRGTFEVLHPDFYAKGLPRPVIGAPVLPDGCRSAFEGEMGELRTRVFLRAAHTRPIALSGARGLLADRYRVIEGCGVDPAFVWQTAWIDEASAERFEGLLRGSLGCAAAGCLPGDHAIARRGTHVVALRGIADPRLTESALSAIKPGVGGPLARLGGAPLEPLPEESTVLVESSSGRSCDIAGAGVLAVAPRGLSLVSGKELTCAMGSDMEDVSVTTKVVGAPYGDGVLNGIRHTLPQSLAALHSHVDIRERYRVTPLGTGLSFVAHLTPPVRFEVVTVPVCGGKRVLALYLRSTTEAGRSMVEDVLSSLRPASVGLHPTCGDPLEE